LAIAEDKGRLNERKDQTKLIDVKSAKSIYVSHTQSSVQINVRRRRFAVTTISGMVMDDSRGRFVSDRWRSDTVRISDFCMISTNVARKGEVLFFVAGVACFVPDTTRMS
jgi:hypothetical protein